MMRIIDPWWGRNNYQFHCLQLLLLELANCDFIRSFYNFTKKDNFDLFLIFFHHSLLTNNHRKQMFIFFSFFLRMICVCAVFWNFYCAVVSFIPNDYPYKNAHFCCCCCCFFGFLFKPNFVFFLLVFYFIPKMCWLKRSFSNYGDGIYLTHSHTYTSSTQHAAT